MTRYTSWVARYVPDLAREEFVNIAIMVGDGHEWVTVTMRNTDRVRHMGGSPEAVRNLLEYLTETPWTVKALNKQRHSALQFSGPAPVYADSAQEAATLLAESLIYEPTPRDGDNR